MSGSETPRRFDLSRRTLLAGSAAAVLTMGAQSAASAKVSPRNYPVYDIKAEFGAVGDGVADDHPAFRRARDQIEANKAQGIMGATLIIPSGTYLVGFQEHVPGQVPYYQFEHVFDVSGLEFLQIEGTGRTHPTLRLKPGLRFGSFHPETGEPHFPTGGFFDRDYRAPLGNMIHLVGCSNVSISNLELDGNSGALLLGGPWGNAGYQLASAGIWANECSDVAVVNVYTHHHGKDGITVLHLGGVPTERKQHTLVNVRSEYNARQGLSWIGGWGLRAVRCQFNHTGRAINDGTGEPFLSAPGDGVDIEPNVGQSTTREGYFYDCEMIDNAGAGAESSNRDGGHTTFDRCTIWGTTKHSVWTHSPNMTFKRCNIYGFLERVYASSDPELATTFIDCTFEDKEYDHPTRKVFRQDWLLAPAKSYGGSMHGVEFTRCTFIANKTKGIKVANLDNLTDVGIFTDCTMEHRWTAPADGEPQAEFNGSTIRSCDFTETLASGDYVITVNNVKVDTPRGSDATHVEGPRLTWGPTGLTGTIPDGTY